MDQQSGSGQWQRRPEASFAPLRSPRAGNNLSADAPVFVPKKPSPPQQQQQPQYGGGHHSRFRGDNGGGGSGGGGGPYGGGSMPHFGHEGASNGGGGPAMVNGGGTDIIAKSNLNDRLRNLQINGPGPAMGHHSYGDNKDIRNSYNHHHQQQPQFPNQHYPQQQRMAPHQQQQQPQIPGLHHQGGFPGGFPVTGMGYSSTALNNHLHHPILGGMASAMDNRGGGGGGGGGGGKNNSAVRNRLQNAQQNAQQMHHHQQQQQHHHQQNHYQNQNHHGGNRHNNHNNHHGGGGHGHGMGNDYGGGPDGDAEQITESETLALDYLTEVIAELYDNPGMFENIQRKLKATFVEFRGNNFVLSNAVEMIFEQSIKEQNFRYMGARLCQLLDSLDDSPSSVLRQLLSMKMEHQQSELLIYLQQEQIKVRGTTLFLAELYMQLRKPHDKRNGEIAMRITSAAKILLSKEGPENIKCVCQCLKLCGFELERDRREDLMSILAQLGRLEGSIDNSTGRFVRSVLELQQKSWGRSEEVVPQANQSLSDSACDEFNDSPVFYGPDGSIMTEEENEFLDMAAPVTFEEFDDDEDPDELVDDENMDMEIKMAFKDFVAHTKNRQQPPY